MEGHGLSHDERRALSAMEEVLRQEAAALDRRLRTMTPRLRHRLPWFSDRPIAYAALLLLIASGVLLAAAVHTSHPSVIWAFTACWTAAVLTGLAALRTPRRRPRRDRR